MITCLAKTGCVIGGKRSEFSRKHGWRVDKNIGQARKYLPGNTEKAQCKDACQFRDTQYVGDLTGLEESPFGRGYLNYGKRWTNRSSRWHDANNTC